ncbi:terminase [Salinisphaera sp. USBA-960]|nr:terminase [Salifodinibacter halophilus]NNC25317.1 terminase [Salifodinibacter halophilus]
MKMPDHVSSPRVFARHLYWQGWRVARIAEVVETNYQTINSWKKRDKWDDANPLERVEGALEARYVQLIVKEAKEGRDFKELDLLGRQLERVARIEKYQASGREADLNPAQANGAQASARSKSKKVKNALTDEQIRAVSEAFWHSLFEYQRTWYRAGIEQRIRNILKSRQIGATWYFAREAIVDALETGRNKIFVSASKAQAHIFRAYIVAFVHEVTGVELTGEPMILANGAELHFLGTNSKTAQGYHGDVYVDEYFWIGRFQEFRKVVSGMAMHKQWRQTYFSTPSSIAHEAYPFWSGELFNRRRPADERTTIDTSHEALAGGQLCADGHWRQIVNVYDAVAGGCDLFDIEQLKLEYSADEFDNLLMCQFVDDSQSAFPLSEMERCLVDSWVAWDDFKPFAPRPLGDEPVWFGYDPGGESEDGDGAGLAIVAPAAEAGGVHRVVERHRLKGRDYESQAEFIRECTRRYDVTHIGIDNNGMGEGVAQIVEKWFPTLTRYRYTPETKSQMVMQAQQMMRRGRLAFDAGWSDLAGSFMAIKRVPTASGRQLTYQASRAGDTGHAELAWAVMHALHNEPIDGSPAHTGSVMEITE